jgi:hypothetical protein
MGETAALAVLDVEKTSAVSRDGRDEPLFIETLAELVRRRTLNTGRTQLHAASRAAVGLRSVEPKPRRIVRAMLLPHSSL